MKLYHHSEFPLFPPDGGAMWNDCTDTTIVGGPCWPYVFFISVFVLSYYFILMTQSLISVVEQFLLDHLLFSIISSLVQFSLWGKLFMNA